MTKTKTPNPVNRPENPFEFVSMASARARQLVDGCVPRVDGSAKPARRAVEEVAAGLVDQVETEDS
jgi:DNA-directed RNA polymerase subunit K/omega